MLELFFLLYGDGALICPMAFIFAMEITVWNFLSSALFLSSSLLVAFFAMLPVFATRPVIAMVSLIPAFAMMPGVSWLLVGDTVNCLLVLHLIGVPWLRVRPLTVPRFLLLVHFVEPSLFPTVGYAVFLHYFK